LASSRAGVQPRAAGLPVGDPGADGAGLLAGAELSVGVADSLGVTVTVTVGLTEPALDEFGPAGWGDRLGWPAFFELPPPMLTPAPCLPATVSDSGWPEANSNPVVTASTAANNPATANASRFGRRSGPGCLPDGGPLVIRYYLGTRVRYATQLGPVADPRIMDWRDALARIKAVTVRRNLEPVLATVKPGQHLIVISPVFRDYRAWQAPWTREVYDTSQLWTRAIAADPRFKELSHLTPDEVLLELNYWKPLQAVVYVRRRLV